MVAKVKIQKWGNDLGVSIPLMIVNEMSLSEGRYVKIQDYENKIIIEPLKSEAYNLNDMLCEITENNIHHSIDWGTPVGNEIW